MPPIASLHRLGRGLQGYLILFDPHAFAIDRQQTASTLPSLLVFREISLDFTPTPHVPCASQPLQPCRQKYESGGNRISASRLYDLSQILGVDTAHFFDGMDQATQNESPALLSRRKSTRSPKKPTKSEDPLIKRETLELVRAYYKISDPKIRNHVRKLFQSVSDASTKTT